MTPLPWTEQDDARIKELRETKRDLTEAERAEIRELRRRETIEAFNRRRAFYAAAVTGLPWVESDGGRAQAGFRGDAGDCVTRAVAIAAGLPYREVYDALAAGQAARGKPRSARDGVAPKVYRRYLDGLGAVWTPTMQIGSGCRVHLAAGEFPEEGRYVARLSKHLAAVVDGIVYDTYDPTRDGTRCVYGVWSIDGEIEWPR